MNKIQSLKTACMLAGVLACPGIFAATATAGALGTGGATANASATGGAPAAPTAAKTGESPFEQLVDDFVFGTLALAPTNATGVGYHVHHGTSLDDLLDDYSPAGIAAARSLQTDIEA